MHKIAIPDYAVKTAMARRGSLRKYDRLDARKTALLVIDMQNAFLLPGMSMEIPHARDIISNINRVAGTLRGCGGTVVWIQVSHENAGDGWHTWFDFHSPRTKEGAIRQLTPGNAGFELHADLQVRDADLVVTKKRLSAFVQGSSNLHELLQARGVDTVVITGTLSNGCCESTARDAMQMNYKTVFVSDANATRTDEEHNATLANMLQTFADVLYTDEYCEELRRQAQPTPA